YAGAVDEHIDAREGLECLLDGRCIAHVELQRLALDLPRKRSCFSRVASGDDDVRASFRKRLAYGFADPAVPARHEGDLVAQKLQSITNPPLRSTISPVMKPASGETRKRTTCANSSGSQKRPTGICAINAPRCVSVS